MDPEAVLELMRSAPHRYETVRAALRYRGHGPTIRYLRERAFRRSGSSEQAPKRPQHPEPNDFFDWQCRIWHAGAYRWRRELDLPGGGTEITACYGTDRFGLPKMWDLRASVLPSGNDPEWLVYPRDHYWTFYLVDDISGIQYRLDGLDLRVDGDTEWASRKAICLVAVPPAGEWEDRDDPDPLAWGADEYELLVDVERGAILRHANKLGGEEFDVLEMEEVHYDEGFADEVFLPPRPLTRW